LRANLKRIEKIIQLSSLRMVPLTDEEIEVKEACEQSLYTFFTYAWEQIEGVPFVGGWHLEALCEHLEALYRRDICDLLINVPPRTGKSSLISVAYPAWVWLKHPEHRFLCSSYALDLAFRDSMKCRRLIESEWYQRLWGDQFKLLRDVKNLKKFENDKWGWRAATSVDSANTGSGGEYLLVDDPNNMKDIYSEASRNNAINWWRGIMSTRFGSLLERRRLIVQQRGHTMDISGYILSLGESDWVHLCLPMEFEATRRSRTVPLPSCDNKVWIDPRTKDGELLWPTQFPARELEKLKRVDFNNQSSLIAGQLQQRPSLEGGGRIKEAWFKHWNNETMPRFKHILMSWDTAMIGKPDSSFSSATTWGVFHDEYDIPNIMLLSVFYDQLDYPDLRKMVKRMAMNYQDVRFNDPMPEHIRKPVDLLLIEEKSTGHLLLRDFGLTGIPVLKFNPSRYGDKIGRCLQVSHFIENGRVWLPTRPPNYKHLTEFSEFFLECATIFPNPSPRSNSSDTIDSMSQAFIRLRDAGWLYMKEEAPPRRESYKEHSIEPYY
jgi:phage terminase large subunit-like protein